MVATMTSPSAVRNRTLCAVVLATVVIAFVGHVYPPAEAMVSLPAASHHDDDHAADALHALLCVATLPAAQPSGCAGPERAWIGATSAPAIATPPVGTATVTATLRAVSSRTGPPLFLLYTTLLI